MISIYRPEEGTQPLDEPKFLVFYSMLVSLFSMFCFNCKSTSPGVTVKQCGTMATVTQSCDSCGKQYQWRSQPFILGRYPAGNILLSFAILMSGVSISKVLLMFKHMGVCVISARTYFVHQNKFLFPAVVQYWEKYRDGLMQTLKGVKEALTWCGDGRFDSMGHSAKYGVYTMYCSTISKIVHFELRQVGLVFSVLFLAYFLSLMHIFSRCTLFCCLVLCWLCCVSALRCVTLSSCSECNAVNR